MRPVTKIVTGLVIAFCAVRLSGLDLLFDPVGWGLCAAGLLPLRRPGDAFARAQTWTICMVPASLVATYASGELPDEPVRDLIGNAVTAGALVTVWLITDAFVSRMCSLGDSSPAALLDVLRWAVAGLGTAGLPAGSGYAELSPVLTLGWFAALVVLVIAL
ncbi:hypothetical protein ACIA8R_03635 [Nonomuraea sp. NPDC051191]|uniref:hypothetical protein n=1 Tax=Nonomuraea sp. NPDC051191 TaxID=3364372 RepID=UPI0037A50D85